MPTRLYLVKDWHTIRSIIPHRIEGRWFWLKKIEKRIVGISSFWDERFENEYRLACQCPKEHRMYNVMKTKCPCKIGEVI